MASVCVPGLAMSTGSGGWSGQRRDTCGCVLRVRDHSPWLGGPSSRRCVRRPLSWASLPGCCVALRTASPALMGVPTRPPPVLERSTDSMAAAPEALGSRGARGRADGGGLECVEVHAVGYAADDLIVIEDPRPPFHATECPSRPRTCVAFRYY